MSMLLMGLGGLAYIAGFVCTIIILIDAFKNEIWKGVVSILCGLYLLYYMFAEFESDNKVLIIIGALLGNIGGAVFMGMAGAMGGK